MITAHESVDRYAIFQSIRVSIQELHSDKVILEDAHGAPFLFKSQDARIWVRIFYRAMQEFSFDELKQEIKKLWVLMPNDAVLYLFYPELNRQQILQMNGLSDRVSFFEYGNVGDSSREGCGIRICKWLPSMLLPSLVSEPEEIEGGSRIVSNDFLQKTRLNSREIEGLIELSLALKRA